MATKKKMLQAAAGVGGDIGAWDLDYAYHDDPLQWDISTLTYRWIKDVSPQDTNMRHAYISPDGSKMYTVGTTSDRVYEYTLSTPFLVITATFVQSFSVASQDTLPNALFFKPDGTKMYIVGSSSDRISEYDLSTAWDISTASYSQQSITVGNSIPSGMFFRQDGTMVYIVDYLTDRVWQYSLSTAWDVSTVTLVHSLSVSAQETVPYGIFLSDDGTKMYVCGLGGDEINEYDLSTPWDVTTASHLQVISVLTHAQDPAGIFMINGIVYVCKTSSPASIVQYVLGGFSVAAQDINPYSVVFKPDGTKMYISGTTGDKIYEYSLSTAWDTSTASYTGASIGLSADPYGIFFKPDGTSFYSVRYNPFGNDFIYRYDLNTAWDLSSGATLNGSLDVTTQDQLPTKVFFKPDGTKMFLLGDLANDVTEYSLSTAWDITTASATQTASVATQDTSPLGFWFKPDGTKMFLAGNSTDTVFEYDLSTAWDISTLSYSGKSLNFQSYDSGFTAVTFSEDGTKMFGLGITLDKVRTFSLGVQP